MGLFSRRKKLDVPLPPSEDVLRFPRSSEIARRIEPEKIKEAVGLQEPKPEELLPPEHQGKELDSTFPEETAMSQRTFFIDAKKPFFLRMQTHQEIYKNALEMKNNSLELSEVTNEITDSEYNDDRQYEKLKNSLKRVHDKLLQVDEAIFKR